MPNSCGKGATRRPTSPLELARILSSALINKKPKVEIGEDNSLRAGDIFLLSSDGLGH
jgi:hypothetical protein